MSSLEDLRRRVAADPSDEGAREALERARARHGELSRFWQLLAATCAEDDLVDLLEYIIDGVESHVRRRDGDGPLYSARCPYCEATGRTGFLPNGDEAPETASPATWIAHSDGCLVALADRVLAAIDRQRETMERGPETA